MSHEAAAVSGVQCPSKWFSEIVGRIDDSRDVFHCDLLGFFPILNGKELCVDASRSFGWHFGVNDLDGGFVITMEFGWVVLWKS